MKVVTFWGTLLRYAREEAEARKSGDPVRLEKAAAAHEAYRQCCLKADEIRLDAPLLGVRPERKHEPRSKGNL
jgi:hypothetical protein